MNVVTHKLSPARSVNTRPLVRIVIVGHVDHGKSTLIGRLLHETKSLPDGKLEALKAVSSRRGKPFEWSFLLDALQTERAQGITLDTSQIRFRTAGRDIVLIDAPGHAEFLRNMITGAAQADAALLIIDASEGVRDQTRRHGYLLHLLGINQVAVIINKMDRVGFDEVRFHEVEADIVSDLSRFGLAATAIIPICARNGDGVARRTPSLAWYDGPTVLDVLDRFSPAKPPPDLPLRIPVQAIYKFDDRRIIAGRIETGRIEVGDTVAIMPRGATARVRSIEAWPSPIDSQTPRTARAGRSVGLLLDREVFIDRGDVISTVEAPATAGDILWARVFWLHKEPLTVGASINVRVGMSESVGTVVSIDNAVDPAEISPTGATAIAQNHVGEIEIALSQLIAVDTHVANPRTGRLVLDRAGIIAGGGLVLAIDNRAIGNDDRRDTGKVDRRSSPAPDLAVEANRLNRLLADLDPAERLARFRREIEGRIVFTTSFGLEDQVILHLILERAIGIDIATIDTGRLFPETYELWAETERRYGRRIWAVYPQHGHVEALVQEHGINGFYDSREARLACCHARKVEPLDRALTAAAGWIVGLRAEQSGQRQGTALVAADDRNLLKLSPLFDWSRDAVRSFAAAHEIPVNALHAKGFPSIGCAPCTRAIAPGEPERAGRWWWEADDKKECGLHAAGNKPPKPIAGAV
jgi:phosphoadenylyl-sulfate reductase (thioredoxin)